MMFNHLVVDNLPKAMLMILQDVQNGVFGWQIRPQMRHGLSRQFVEHVRMVIVGNVIVINQSPHQIILKATLLYNPVPADQAIPLACP